MFQIPTDSNEPVHSVYKDFVIEAHFSRSFVQPSHHRKVTEETVITTLLVGAYSDN